MLSESARFNLGTAAHDQPAEPAARVAAPATRQAASRSGWPAKSVFAARGRSSWCSSRTSRRPIIRSFDSHDMRSIVRAWVETDDRTLVARGSDHARSAATKFAFDHVISVEFKENRALGLLVPAKMQEDVLRRPESKRARRRLVFELSALSDVGANRAAVTWGLGLGAWGLKLLNVSRPATASCACRRAATA